jgi:hypothetical protein
MGAGSVVDVATGTGYGPAAWEKEREAEAPAARTQKDLAAVYVIRSAPSMAVGTQGAKISA